MLPDQSKCDSSLCPICTSSKVKYRFKVASPYLKSEKYKILMCRECGHQFAIGKMDLGTLGKVFDKAFHSTSQQAASSKFSPIVINADKRVQWLGQFLLSGELLDVGAGRGYFVKSASVRYSSEGIDLSSRAEEFGESIGIKIRSGDFVSADFGERSYDILTMWDVLAGIPDPDRALRKVQSVVRSGGYFVFTVPVSDSWCCRILRSFWPFWIPPVNVHYYSARSIELILQKFGFEIVQAKFIGKRVSFNFVLLKLFRALGFHRLSNWAVSREGKLSLVLNTFDILTVAARKKVA